MTSDPILNAKVDALTEQVALLVAAERRRSELFEDFTPIMRQALGALSSELGGLEERGYFAFGKGLLNVLDRIVSGYTPEDIEELGRNVVTILDTLRALTQPEVMALAAEVSGAVEDADKMAPVGVVGMAKAARDADAQQGMAVLVEALRRLGKGVKRAGHRESLQRLLGARRSGTTSPRPMRPESRSTDGAAIRTVDVGSNRAAVVAAPAAAPFQSAPAAQAPSSPMKVDGVELTAEGFLVDYRNWTPELATRLAASIGVELTDKHWQLVEFARQEYEKTKMSPNIRRLTTGSGLSTKEVYGLFPKAPGKCAAMIAGLPKPVGCI